LADARLRDDWPARLEASARWNRARAAVNEALGMSRGQPLGTTEEEDPRRRVMLASDVDEFYRANALAAERTHNAAGLLVIGRVVGVGRDLRGRPRITMTTGSGRDLQAVVPLRAESLAATLNPGEPFGVLANTFEYADGVLLVLTGDVLTANQAPEIKTILAPPPPPLPDPEPPLPAYGYTGSSSYQGSSVYPSSAYTTPRYAVSPGYPYTSTQRCYPARRPTRKWYLFGRR
jgi:hypothetical protein